MNMGPVRLVLMTTMLLLSGCAVAEEMQTTLFDTTKVNLTDSTYAATDMLAPQAKARITQNTPIRIAPLTDVAAPNETTAFGNQVANQIGSRLVQLGYNVQSVAAPPLAASDSPVQLTPVELSAAPKITQGPVKASVGRGGDCVVGGTYTRMKNTILVSLRIVQAPDQRIIAAYDYNVPLTGEIDKLSLSAAERRKKETALFGMQTQSQINNQ
ncbi:MAG: hypothetical protein JWO78_589 [Micavibrio sp.]|nr:hypothetical protein [Micavibrio sp.]